MSRRADGLHKSVVILAGVFANRLLSTVEQRFAVRLVGDEFIDFDNVDFTNVSLAIVFGCGHRIAERHLNKATFINLHGSLLPLGRGPHPHIWNWINGEPHGVTIHKMSAEIDRGARHRSKKSRTGAVGKLDHFHNIRAGRLRDGTISGDLG